VRGKEGKRGKRNSDLRLFLRKRPAPTAEGGSYGGTGGKREGEKNTCASPRGKEEKKKGASLLLTL